MQWIVVLCCSFLLFISTKCDDQTCGDNVVVSSINDGNCAKEYENLNIEQYFGTLDFNSCGFFFTANFTPLLVDSWRENFISCTDDNSLSINSVIQGNLPLQTARCFKDNYYNTNNICECRMDCLLQFDPFSPITVTSFIYLEHVGCNESDFNAALLVYTNATNVIPAIQKKPGYSSCASPVVSPSVSVSPSFTSGTVTNSIDSSVVSTMTTPTGTPSSCTSYNIQAFNSSASYCQCNNSDTSLFKEALNDACTKVSSTPPSSYYTRLISTFSYQTLLNCIQDKVLKETFQTNCNTSSWMLTKVVCDCSTLDDCSDATAKSSSDCVLEYKQSGQNSIRRLFIGGLDSSSRNSLFSKTIGCPALMMQDKMCSSTMSMSPTSTVATTSNSFADYFSELYIQLAVGLIGGSLVLLLLCFVMVAFVIVIKRRKRSSYRTGSKEAGSPQNMIGSNALSPTDSVSFNFNNATNTGQVRLHVDYSKWRRIFARHIVEYSQIEVMETIGEGAFGLVQKGSLKGKHDRFIQVAIKAMKDASTPEQVEDFITESAIMLDFDHPNVLGLLGVCFNTENELPLIILPYMANGDLKSYLQAKRHGTDRGNIPEGLSITLLMRMCLDIAKGMAYLARTKFVHRDLAARNCMVDENLIVRVADFGLSRDVYSKDYYRLERRVKLPVKWLPPESLHDSIFNERTDVWSFGVTCWEVFSLGRTPYPSIDNADILEYVENGFRLKKTPLCPKEVYLLLSQCWDESPEFRPCFTIIVESMKAILKKWESQDNTLRNQMELELKKSVEQDGYESDSMELEGSGSMSTKIGSRARYPPDRRHNQRISTSSSVGMSTINSRTALLSNSTVCESPPIIAAVRPGDFEHSPSSDDECKVQDGGHSYINFKPSQEECKCCTGLTDSSECKYSRHNSTSSSGNHCNAQSITPPMSVPMFEMFYNDTPHNQSTASLKLSSSVKPPNHLELHERDLEMSQSSVKTEMTTLPETPMDPNLYKTLETSGEVEPADYAVPVSTTPSQTSHTLPNGIHTRRGGPMTARTSDSSIGGKKRSRTCIGSTPVSSSSIGEVDISATNHFYFTLDPSGSNTTPPVFDSDTSNSQNSCDTPKTAKTSQSGSESENPIFTGYHMTKHHHQREQPEHLNFYPTTEIFGMCDEVAAINGSTPHRHMVLEHSRQKFDSELTP